MKKKIKDLFKNPITIHISVAANILLFGIVVSLILPASQRANGTTATIIMSSVALAFSYYQYFHSKIEQEIKRKYDTCFAAIKDFVENDRKYYDMISKIQTNIFTDEKELYYTIKYQYDMVCNVLTEIVDVFPLGIGSRQEYHNYMAVVDNILKIADDFKCNSRTNIKCQSDIMDHCISFNEIIRVKLPSLITAKNELYKLLKESIKIQ